MARFEGTASIARVLNNPEGWTVLDIKPDGLGSLWANVPPERAREALACALTAIAGGFKLYVSLPDDPNSNIIENIGLTNTPDPK